MGIYTFSIRQTFLYQIFLLATHMAGRYLAIYVHADV